MPTQDDHTKRVEKIRALLANAASTNHDEERHAFETKALQLMAAWEIEERDLRTTTTTTTTDAAYDTQTIDVSDFGNGQAGAAVLVQRVCRLFGAYGVRTSPYPRKFAVKVVATPDVWAIAEPLVTHLLRQLRTDMLTARPSSKMSYARGWAAKVGDRLEAAQAKIYSDSKALVPTTDAAKAAYLAANPDVRLVRSRPRVNAADYYSGEGAGARADLGQARMTGPAAALKA